MKIALGPLARFGIESELDSTLGDAVRAALSHYRGKVEAGRPPLRPPSFLEGHEPADGATMVLDLTIDPETEAILEREALAQGIDLERLAAHTVLTYLAEFDFLSAPGRVH
ncbi:MAG: hypothetical protein ACRDLL_14045 [Solirubrobacterales bacterium]